MVTGILMAERFELFERTLQANHEVADGIVEEGKGGCDKCCCCLRCCLQRCNDMVSSPSSWKTQPSQKSEALRLGLDPPFSD